MRAGTGDTGTPIVRMTEDASQGPCHGYALVALVQATAVSTP